MTQIIEGNDNDMELNSGNEMLQCRREILLHSSSNHPNQAKACFCVVSEN